MGSVAGCALTTLPPSPQPAGGAPQPAEAEAVRSYVEFNKAVENIRASSLRASAEEPGEDATNLLGAEGLHDGLGDLVDHAGVLDGAPPSGSERPRPQHASDQPAIGGQPPVAAPKGLHGNAAPAASALPWTVPACDCAACATNHALLASYHAAPEASAHGEPRPPLGPPLARGAGVPGEQAPGYAPPAPLGAPLPAVPPETEPCDCDHCRAHPRRCDCYYCAPFGEGAHEGPPPAAPKHSHDGSAAREKLRLKYASQKRARGRDKGNKGDNLAIETVPGPAHVGDTRDVEQLLLFIEGDAAKARDEMSGKGKSKQKRKQKLGVEQNKLREVASSDQIGAVAARRAQEAPVSARAAKRERQRKKKAEEKRRRV